MNIKWVFVLSLLLASSSAAAQDGTGAPRYRIAQPVQHGNLSVFLIHGDNEAEHPNVLTLQEAMEQKLLVVHETSSVNQLAVENVSSDHEVFIQSGDIVKGGKQDRVLSVDLLVPPRSGAVSIEAFCVESGRWSQRAGESAAQFSSSNDRIVSKELKLAANKQRSQAEVWQRVSEVQDKLSNSVGSPVAATASQSSLQLSLENGKLSASVDEYLGALSGLLEGKSDVVGYAFAINGKINSADTFASHDLFAKLWPKLLKAMATEAVAEAGEANPATRVDVREVQAFLDSAEAGAPVERAVTSRVKLVTRENEDDIVFETHDTSNKVAIHRSFVRKR